MVIIDQEKCNGCGLCKSDCIGHVIEVEEKASILRGCFQCGHCVAICPTGAVSIEGKDYDMADVEEVGAGFGIDEKTMLHAIKTRRSIRHFKKTCPERAEIEKLLEAGRFSPTASNAQNVSYIVITEKTQELAELCIAELRKLEHDEDAFYSVFPPPMSLSRVNFRDDDFFFKGAPAVILTLSPNEVNASIASANMELMAASMGLGMLYVGFFTRLVKKNEAIRGFLGLKEDDRVVTCLALGRPDVVYLRTPPRKKAKAEWI